MCSRSVYQFGLLCLIVSLHNAVVETKRAPHYIGCFKEWSGKGSEANRGLLFPDFHQAFDYMTPKLCLEMCSRLGIQYSGLQYGNECFCSKRAPDRSRRTDETTCAMKCSGDPNKICGGYQRLSVYDSGYDPNAVEHVPDGKYVGCFKELKNGRLFPEFRQKIEDLHPKICFDTCFKSGFKYSGIEHRKECYCTNHDLDMGRKTDDMECQLTCPGDVTQKCGGDLRLSVYRTGLKDEDNVPGGTYMGCLKEIPGRRILEGVGSWVFSDKLTPQMCLEECYRNNFKISGTQYGLDCRCSNKELDMSRMTTDDDCDMWCFGDRSINCGGFMRISVFTTGYPGVKGDINSTHALAPIGRHGLNINTEDANSAVGDNEETTLIESLIELIDPRIETTENKEDTPSQQKTTPVELAPFEYKTTLIETVPSQQTP